MKWREWERKARSAAGRIWGYAELIDDDPEGAARAFNEGVAPEEYIREIGTDLDLITPDPYTAADLARLYPKESPDG